MLVVYLMNDITIMDKESLGNSMLKRKCKMKRWQALKVLQIYFTNGPLEGKKIPMKIISLAVVKNPGTKNQKMIT